MAVTNHERPITLTLLPTAPTQLITGAGVGESTNDRVPAAIFRRTAANTTYIWAISLSDHAPKLATLPSAPGSVTVSVNEKIKVTADPSTPSVTIEKTQR
jgi:hypothetical protein